MPNENTKYKVLCWGACGGDEANPCGIEYLSTEGAVWKRALTGDVIEDISPAHVARQRWIERGVLVPVGVEAHDAIERAILTAQGYTPEEIALVQQGGDDQ